MQKIGLGLDYNNICKDYNTVYLDRDNNDRETVKCMKSVMDWFNKFLSELMQTFDYGIYRMNQNVALELKEIVQKRFFFYSLEKEMIAQTFILQAEAKTFDSLAHWSKSRENTLLIKNDDEGEGIYFYFNENAEVHTWIEDKLKDYTLDSVPFEEV
ncbi:MAG: Unknown protein [uncultured Sulfurovum sp.]|uniref:Uncharacterized protein n=1 Tax=uncultured Sulfurovum sp. TaxID=269237 RepID=A0A6S6U7L1_9BACT|nr:MAG: Unknown protein [uncultured Sulfurovum sp.]